MRKSVFISLFISLFVHASYQPIYGMRRSGLILNSAPFTSDNPQNGDDNPLEGLFFNNWRPLLTPILEVWCQ